ncbi:MAG: sigma-70 family RNA polymerase sigma factor [Myxococcota bacterium]
MARETIPLASTWADIPDADLLRQAAQGEPRAFKELVGRHATSLRFYVTRLLGSGTAAEDTVQQALLDAYRGAAGFRGESEVRTWLFGIARRAAHRAHAKLRQAPPSVEESLLVLGQSAGWGANPETLAMQSQRSGAIHAALSRLVPTDREILVLRDIEQLSGSEVAFVLGLTMPAMKSRLHRARLRLAVELKEQARGDLNA